MQPVFANFICKDSDNYGIIVIFAPRISIVYQEMIEIGQKYTSELTVTDAVTAIKVGSGDLPVLATPMMMALMENAAMLAVKDELPDGCTTVGGHIESSHLRFIVDKEKFMSIL